MGPTKKKKEFPADSFGSQKRLRALSCTGMSGPDGKNSPSDFPKYKARIRAHNIMKIWWQFLFHLNDILQNCINKNFIYFNKNLKDVNSKLFTPRRCKTTYIGGRRSLPLDLIDLSLYRTQRIKKRRKWERKKKATTEMHLMVAGWDCAWSPTHLGLGMFMGWANPISALPALGQAWICILGPFYNWVGLGSGERKAQSPARPV